MDPEDPWAAQPDEAGWAGQPDAYHAAPPESWTTDAGHTEFGGEGTVYTLHFDPPIEPYPGADRKFCAGHYTGHADAGRLDARLAEHAAGLASGAKGAKITRAQVGRGGSWRVHTEPGGYATERRRKQESAYRRCPDADCAAAREAEGVRPARRARPEAEPEAGG